MTASLSSFNSLAEVKDKHVGCPAFIFGSGPSINEFDITKIPNNAVSLCCNQGMTALEHSNYFCMTDGSIPGSSYFDYGIEHSDYVMMCSRGMSDLPDVKSRFEQIKDKSFFFNRRYGSGNFDFKDDSLLIDGYDVVHVIAHLAFIMGCSPIIFVGVDLCYKDGQKYCNPTIFNNEVKYGANFHIPTGSDPVLQTSFENWKRIKSANPQVNFLNANPWGRLSELFNLWSPNA